MSDDLDQARQVVTGLGGPDNIVQIDPCTTRLRALLVDAPLVDRVLLRTAGAHGVMVSGKVVQVVMGPQVDTLALDIADLL